MGRRCAHRDRSAAAGARTLGEREAEDWTRPGRGGGDSNKGNKEGPAIVRGAGPGATIATPSADLEALMLTSARALSQAAAQQSRGGAVSSAGIAVPGRRSRLGPAGTNARAGRGNTASAPPPYGDRGDTGGCETRFKAQGTRPCLPLPPNKKPRNYSRHQQRRRRNGLRSRCRDSYNGPSGGTADS